ncbi:hypothetical protein [Streptomyces sp. NPDC057010]|uniref:hypothetical protein n=1 Tax=Streptomyces sp. NPDC057010 TaxID=3345997 RepID=UPI003638E35D
MVGWTEGFDPRGAVVAGFDAMAEVFAWGVTAGVPARGEDDEATEADVGDERDGMGKRVEVADSDGAGEGAGGGAGDPEGCAGMPIAGASACPPTRLLPIATARIAPTTETGQPRPRRRRPRRPDWSTNTGAGAGSSKLEVEV